MRTLARVGLTAAIPILVFCALFALQLGSHQHPGPASKTRLAARATEAGTPAATPDPDTPDSHDQMDDSPGSVDLYGNDVTDAVAEYKFDGAGALYELHSPQTEVPRLRSPKT